MLAPNRVTAGTQPPNVPLPSITTRCSSNVPVNQWLSTRGDFAPAPTFGSVWSNYWLSQLWVVGLLAYKDYPAQTIKSTEVKKCWLSLKNALWLTPLSRGRQLLLHSGPYITACLSQDVVFLLLYSMLGPATSLLLLTF